MVQGLDPGCIITIIVYLSPYMQLVHCMCLQTLVNHEYPLVVRALEVCPRDNSVSNKQTTNSQMILPQDTKVNQLMLQILLFA